MKNYNERYKTYQGKLKEKGYKRSSLLWTDEIKLKLSKKAEKLNIPLQELLLHTEI